MTPFSLPLHLLLLSRPPEARGMSENGLDKIHSGGE